MTLYTGFDTKGSPGVQDSQIIMPDSLFLPVGSPTDSLNLGKISQISKDFKPRFGILITFGLKLMTLGFA